MKTLAVVVLVMALSLISASTSPDEVEAELQAYVQSQISAVLRKPYLGRSGGGLACYDKYIPLINAATANSKTETQTCNNRATGRREDELNKVKDERTALDNQVQTVQGTLEDCSKQTEVLQFLTCLKDNSQLLQSTVEQVTKTSTSLANGLTSVYATIDNSENLCIQGVIDKVKADTDALTAALQSCLMNGFDEPQPESTAKPEPQPIPTEEPQPETSPAPEPEPESTVQPSEAPQPETSPAVDEVFPNPDLLPEESL